MMGFLSLSFFSFAQQGTGNKGNKEGPSWFAEAGYVEPGHSTFHLSLCICDSLILVSQGLTLAVEQPWM